MTALVAQHTWALQAQAWAWLEQGTPAVVVELEAVSGSAPREAGTRMLVAAQWCAGTIGGGHLEWEAIALARGALATGELPPPRRWVLGASLGQCCGGTVRVRWALLTAEAVRSWNPPPLTPVMVYGAGHVGCAVVRLLSDLPYRIDWVDTRDGAFDPMQSPHAAQLALHPAVQAIATDDPVACALAAPPDAVHLVMTHSHDQDFAVCTALLQRSAPRFLGLIGSAPKRQRFEQRWAHRGLPQERLAHLHCPVGIASIAHKQPAAIAISVLAQLLSLPHFGASPRPGADGSQSAAGGVAQAQRNRADKGD